MNKYEDIVIPDNCLKCGSDTFIERGRFSGGYSMYVANNEDNELAGQMVYDVEPEMTANKFGECMKCGARVRLYR